MSWNMSSSPRIHIGMVCIKSSEHWECTLTKLWLATLSHSSLRN